MSTRQLRRRGRLPAPVMPSGDLNLQGPPELPRVLPRNPIFLVLPAVMIVSSAGFVFVGGVSATSIMMGAMMAISTLGMMAGGAGAPSRRGQLEQDRRDYLRYLETVRADLRRARLDQRDTLEWRHPHPRALATLVRSQRVWERRRSHPDFLRVRIARGQQRLAVRAVPPPTGPVDELEPTCAAALRRLVRSTAVVANLPLTLQMRGFAAVAIGGQPGSARGLVRAALAELTLFHPPEELLIGVVSDATHRADWEWLKWAPHVQHPRLRDATGPQRMFCPSMTTLEEWLSPELAGRPRFSRTVLTVDGPHVVVVVDSGEVGRDSRLMTEEGLAGVTVLDLSDATAALPGRARLRIEAVDGRLGAWSLARGTEWLGRIDVMSVVEAETIARSLAPLRLSVAARADEPLLGATELTELLVAHDVGGVRTRPAADRLRVPIGVDGAGQPVELDLKEAALDGMGPHGLVIGATGSGKSELLRTLVIALAATHSSESLNFVLIDFKGGATFAGLAALPHTAAVITNLADDLTMVDRMRDALLGELNRRQELLRTAGRFDNVRDYERARDGGADLAPVPTLVVVCDEFSELLSGKPDFADLFVTIGRLGRSLGIHLLLASQRLEEGRLRGLESHLSYRICLKTFSAAESRTVLGVADAYELPPVPGSALLKHSNAPMVRFKAAYVSGPYRPAGSTDPVAGLGAAPVARPFLAEFVAGPSVVSAEGHKGRGATPSALDVMVEQLAGQGPAAHEVWLPPLAESPTLDQLVPALVVTADRGICVPGWDTGRLSAPIAWVDRPFLQRRDEFVLQLAGAAGHVAVVGGPRSGKSVTLCSLLSMLALTHTPEEVCIYGVDLGGGALTSLAGLPHVGSVAGRQDVELVRRMIAEVSAMVARRERETVRQGRPDVFLVIDGWLPFRQEFPELEADVTALAAQGLSYGVHVVLAANRWADIRPALRDQIGTRLELRLGDPTESEVDRRLAADVPTGRPGRGLSDGREHLLMALPRINSRPTDADLTDGVADLVRRVAEAWHADPDHADAPPVRLLPARVSYREVAAVAGPSGVPIGLNERELAPVVLDLDADPLFLVFGDGESGKSTFLRTVVAGVVERYPPDQARILIVDYRRTLLDVIPPGHLAGFAGSAPAATALLADLRAQLETRLPGPEVTAEQLRERSWWSGRQIIVLVDDYDLVATPSGNPLAALIDLLPHAKDIGLRVIVCRRTGGASRALFEPVLQRVRELGGSGLVLSGSGEEGILLGGTRPMPLPPGRGVLVRRRGASELVQIADPGWLR
jgi:DNA segregation ATPase FtsK/SpoIIIE, S-DNA-T family